MKRNRQQNNNSSLNIEQLLITKNYIGVDNVISTADLARLLGLETTSALRYHIRRCRKLGEVIASTTSGYYYPANENELEEYCEIYKSKADTMLNTVETVKRNFVDLRL